MKKPYRIVPKRDFGAGPGFWINRAWVKSGFIVTDGRCNIMPGACWFRSIAEAMDALTILLNVGHNADRFWDAMRAKRVVASA